MILDKHIKLKPFQNLVWTSEENRQLYQKTISDISQAVQNAEIESVVRFQRPCSWQTRSLRNLPQFATEMMKKGLLVVPLRLVGKWGSGFIHYTPAVDPKDPNPNVYCIVTRNIENASAFEKAFKRGDHVSQGELLGFPSCCTKFFTEEWKKGYFDPIWQLSMPYNYRVDGVPENTKDISWCKWHPYSNPLLRYIGLRVGFHIPCSLSCKATIKIATDRIKLIEPELQEVLTFLLMENMTWTAHRGVLEVKTKYFYFTTQTVPCVEKYIVELKS